MPSCQPLHDWAFGAKADAGKAEIDACNRQVDAAEKKKAEEQQREAKEKAEAERRFQENLARRQQEFQNAQAALDRAAVLAPAESAKYAAALDQAKRRLDLARESVAQRNADYAGRLAAAILQERQADPGLELQVVDGHGLSTGQSVPTPFGQSSAPSGAPTEGSSPPWSPEAAAGLSKLISLSDQVKDAPNVLDHVVSWVSTQADAVALEVPFLGPLATALDTYKEYLDIVKARSDALGESNLRLRASIQNDLRNAGQAPLFGQCAGGDASACRGIPPFLTSQTAGLEKDNKMLYVYFAQGFDSNNWTSDEKERFLSGAMAAAVPLTYSKRLAQAVAWCKKVGSQICPP